jgi:hypothetical protein
MVRLFGLAPLLLKNILHLFLWSPSMNELTATAMANLRTDIIEIYYNNQPKVDSSRSSSSNFSVILSNKPFTNCNLKLPVKLNILKRINKL